MYNDQDRTSRTNINRINIDPNDYYNRLMDYYNPVIDYYNPVKYVIIQARVVRKVDNAMHRTNHYPVDSVVCFVNTYPLDSDLSGG